MIKYIGIGIFTFGFICLIWSYPFGIIAIITGAILFLGALDKRKSLQSDKSISENNEENTFEILNEAKRSEISIERLQELSKEEDSNVRKAVITNRNISVEILQKLSNDNDEEVRKLAVNRIARIVEDPNTSIDLLRKSAENKNGGIRRSIASNPSTPIELQKKLANDNNELVRGSIASNPKASVEILNQLAKDSNKNVRKKAIFNPNCTDEIKNIVEKEESKGKNKTNQYKSLAVPNDETTYETGISPSGIEGVKENRKNMDCYFYYNQGNAYKRKGSYEEAILEYTYAISRKPDFDDAYLNRGIANFSLLNINEAIYDFNQAIKINPKKSNAYFCRGECYNWIGNSQSLAIEDFTKAINLTPSDDEAYKKLCLAYINLGKNKEALEDLNQAISINKENANAYFCRASIYVEKGDSTQGKNDLKKSAELYEKQGIKPSAEKAWELYKKL